MGRRLGTECAWVVLMPKLYMTHYLTWIGILLSFSSGAAEPCKVWSDAQTLTQLPVHTFPEVSGMAASEKYPGRYYFVNDSGDGGKFYAMDLPTGRIQQVEIQGFKGWDSEALTLGPCGKRATCIFVGDIGDNSNRRKFIRIAAVQERDVFKTSERPLFHTKLTYPDGAHDSEGFVVTKSGDLILFSKEFGFFSTDPTRIYKTTVQKLMKASNVQLEKIGEMEMDGRPLLTVTDAALSADQKSLFLMGYFNAFEISFPTLMKNAVSKEDKVTMAYESFLTTGGQTEAATYSTQTHALVWTYESPKADSSLLQKTCNQSP